MGAAAAKSFCQKLNQKVEAAASDSSTEIVGCLSLHSLLIPAGSCARLSPTMCPLAARGPSSGTSRVRAAAAQLSWWVRETRTLPGPSPRWAA